MTAKPNLTGGLRVPTMSLKGRYPSVTLISRPTGFELVLSATT
jgi:hypothetical protein